MTGAKVKPLDWHNFDAWTYWAEAVCGTYHVEERNGWWQVELRVGGLAHIVAVTDDTLPANLEAAKAAAQADYAARILAALEPVAAPDLSDPVTVHANMLRGTIAKPTVEQIIHLYGVDALAKALAPVIVREAGIEPVAAPDPAAIREAALREAARLVSARCDAYVAEHGTYDYSTGTTEYPGDGAEWVEEWTDIESAILALIQKGAAE